MTDPYDGLILILQQMVDVLGTHHFYVRLLLAWCAFNTLVVVGAGLLWWWRNR